MISNGNRVRLVCITLRTILELALHTGVRCNRLLRQTGGLRRQAPYAPQESETVTVWRERGPRIPAQIIPTYLSCLIYSRTRCCTGELVEIVSAPFAPPGMTSKS